MFEHKYTTIIGNCNTVIKELNKSAISEKTVDKYVKDFLPEALNAIKEITGKDMTDRLNSSEIDKNKLIDICTIVAKILIKYSNEKEQSYTQIDNSSLYHKLINALSTKDFTQNGTWYQADLSIITETEKINAIAELKPDLKQLNIIRHESLDYWKEEMTKHLMEMDDLTADVCDVIMDWWLKNAASPESTTMITADDFLRYKGLQPQKSGSGRRGGYKDEWRNEISKHVNILASTWITVNEMELSEPIKGKKVKKSKWHGESPAIVIEFKFGKESDSGKVEYPWVWDVKPGKVFSNFLFGEGRNIAWRSRKALQYDRYRQYVEKRLTRYFAWYWHTYNNSSNMMIFSVGSILKVVRKDIDKKNPSKTKNRLDDALDTLLEDGVIANWNYADFDENIVGKKGWTETWLDSKIIVESPSLIIPIDDISGNNADVDAINNLLTGAIPVDAHSNNENKEFDYKSISIVRKERRLSLTTAAKEIGISVSRLSRIERGERASDETIEKIKNWINNM